MRTRLIVAGVLGALFVFIGIAMFDRTVLDPAHATVHEMDLQIDECGDRRNCDGVEGTLATDVAAWALANRAVSTSLSQPGFSIYCSDSTPSTR